MKSTALIFLGGGGSYSLRHSGLCVAAALFTQLDACTDASCHQKDQDLMRKTAEFKKMPAQKPRILGIKSCTPAALLHISRLKLQTSNLKSFNLNLFFPHVCVTLSVCCLQAAADSANCLGRVSFSRREIFAGSQNKTNPPCLSLAAASRSTPLLFCQM